MTKPHPVTRRIVGVPSEVANVLRAAQAQGRLISYGKPEPLARHRVAITVTLLEAAPPRERPTLRQRLRQAGIVAGIVLGSAALLGLAWLVWLALQWIAAHWVLVLVGFFVVSLLISLAKGEHR